MKINREMMEFFGLTVVAPAIIYFLIEHHLSIHTENERLLGVALAVCGMIVWVVRNN
jgi:hypothetical protein